MVRALTIIWWLSCMCEDIRCIYMPLAFKGLMGIKYLFIYKQNLNSFVYENLPLLSSLAINLVMILFAATQQVRV